MLVVICGPPAAGKTTVATRAHERLTAAGHEFRLLHSDDFSRRRYEQMYERVADSDDDWLLDGTFYQPEWQERFRELGARFVIVTASLEASLARNRAREDPIDERGVRVIHREFVDPWPDRRLDTDELAVEEAVDRVVEAVESWIEGESGE